MDEREVECSNCNNTTTIIQDKNFSGWTFTDSNWAVIGCSRLCPKCKERYLKVKDVRDSRYRQYPELNKTCVY